MVNEILRKPNLATASRDSNWHTPSVVEPVPVWEHSLFLKSVKSTPTESWTLSPSSPLLKSPILLWRSVSKIVWFFFWRRIFATQMSGETLIANIPLIENPIIAKFSTFRVRITSNSYRFSKFIKIRHDKKNQLFVCGKKFVFMKKTRLLSSYFFC